MKHGDLQKKFATEDQEVVNDAFKALAGTYGGRRFFWWLLGLGGIGQTPFATDPNLTAFNCGMQNLCLAVQARLVSASPDNYVEMMKENAALEADRASQLSDAAIDNVNQGVEE